MERSVEIFDSTLRDGAQGEGISFSVEDKLAIVQKLDELGVTFIEAGNPGSNPKDLEFFRRVNETQRKHAQLVAFGSTRRKGIKAEDDGNIRALLAADTPVVAVFGKCWDLHVTQILGTTLAENLSMIEDTCRLSWPAGASGCFLTPSISSTATRKIRNLPWKPEGGPKGRRRVPGFVRHQRRMLPR